MASKKNDGATKKGKFRSVDQNAIRERIARARYEAQMSQTQLAESIGMSVSSLSTALRFDGGVFFTLEQLGVIRKCFKFSWDYLIDGKNTTEGHLKLIDFLRYELSIRDQQIKRLENEVSELQKSSKKSKRH